MANLNSRNQKVKVKTAKGRKLSSTRWLERQLNDPFVQQAKIDGYRSRAAYKLIQINEKFGLLHPGQLVIDLGAAPGGWTQVAAKSLNPSKTPSSHIIGIDLQPMEPMADATIILGDFNDLEVYEQLIEQMHGRKADVILSDMASPACGNSQVDHDRIIVLCEMVFDFAYKYLNHGGSVVVKVLRGGTEQELLTKIKHTFEIVKHFKPDASRKDSAEMYLVAQGFRG
ncbi:RlmE family RNA methyltransferase [Rickettsiales endosymbiont of Stachyamoeba lipophora]|uniref:RlmE family RNA methyltransferase n=1 Tax=Rickettsiales endosymbiont of Stachyamoeba lipophora TaxID=2486578 RepID=UPI000F64AEE4|nr:RlmE family RNA methyltransferase [Rickettsiales endosymbiont of Stachyamoeba lipophora]AZL15231.1 RlmE family RNA methyltransferase [Rickettsiales endosymbiont of Stachyamoeba lipophora]